MSRKLHTALAWLVVVAAAAGCQSLNQVTPAELDDPAIEAEVRAKIAEDVPEKTFDVGVSVRDGVVTLSGTASSAEERRKIAAAAADVRGVRSVINNISVR